MKGRGKFSVEFAISRWMAGLCHMPPCNTQDREKHLSLKRKQRDSPLASRTHGPVAKKEQCLRCIKKYSVRTHKIQLPASIANKSETI